MNQSDLLLKSVDLLTESIELRDSYTGRHSQRVTCFAEILGRQLQLSAEDLELIRYLTPLHDIGKIGIEDGILRKPGPLSSAEFEVMKTHTSLGVSMLQPIPELHQGLLIVRSHHERWDGTGYPDRLRGENIPRLARIVAVAEAFDAMIFDTPYRQAQSVEGTIAEIEIHRGTQFDPEVVAAFLQASKKVVEEVKRMQKDTHLNRDVVA